MSTKTNTIHTYHEILNEYTICSPFLVSDVIELGSWKANIGVEYIQTVVSSVGNTVGPELCFKKLKGGLKI